MLNQQNLESSFKVANKAWQATRTLAPAAETPLKEAVDASLIEFQVMNDAKLDGDVGTADGIVNLLASSSSEPDINGVYRHDVVMKDLVDRIAPVVQRNIFLAKNAVVPAVNDAFGKYNVADEAITASSYTDFTIDPVETAPFWNNPSFQQMVERYRDTLAGNVKLYSLKFPIEGEEAYVAISTGIESFDQANRDYFKNADSLSSMLGHVFGPNATGQIDEWLATRPGAADFAGVYFLAAKHFIDNPPDSLSMDLNDYREYMTAIMARAGRSCAYAFDRIDSVRRGGNFVLEVKGNRNFEVDALAWNAACASAIDTEVLFGAALGDGIYNLKALVDSADAHRATYARYIETRKSSMDLQRAADRRAALVDVVREAAGNLAAPENAEAAKKRVIDLLANAGQSQFEDPYKLIRTTLCNAVYPTMDLERILTLYDTCHGMVSSGEPREVAALTLIFYVTDWLTDQINVRQAAAAPAL